MKIDISIMGYRISDFSNIYNYINPILLKFRTKNYGGEISTIFIMPIIMPEDFHDDYKELIRIYRTKKNADVRLFIDYDKFMQASLEMRQKIFIKTIILSIKKIDEKLKGGLNGENLVEDLLSEFNITLSEIKEL